MTRVRHSVLRAAGSGLLVPMLVAAGCGSADQLAGPPGDVLQFDAATLVRLDAAVDDAGGMNDEGVESDAAVEDSGVVDHRNDPTVVRNGVLTNALTASFSEFSPDFQLVSFTVIGIEGVNFDSVLVYAEVRNVSSIPQCTVFIDDLNIVSSSFGGIYDILGILSGAPYEDADFPSTVSTDCIPPGGIGILNGIENDVDLRIVDNATSISLAFDPSNFGTYVPNSAAPTLMFGSFNEIEGGWAVRGSATFPETVYNINVEAALRGPNGLIYDVRNAYHLGTLSSFTPWSWETFPTIYGQPNSLVLTSSFIKSSTLRLAQASTVEGPEVAERDRRTSALAAARIAAGL